jgi:XRE family transcriptional regulator, regulator of sulfur utilization
VKPFEIPNVRYNEQEFYMQDAEKSIRGRKKNGGPDGDTAPQIGKVIQRLRKAYNMSLSGLSEQSGVAKSIISQIERNETNPTIGTVMRLSRALDTTLEEVLRDGSGPGIIEHQPRSGVPILESQDGLCRLAIAGPLDLVDRLQWYDFHAAPKGVLESDPHPPGTVEHLYLVKGELEVTCGEEVKALRQGEAIRFRGDRPHRLLNAGEEEAHAVMVLVMKQFAPNLAS